MDNWSIHQITTMVTWLGFFSTVVLTYYYYLRFRHKERITLIEKNVDLSDFYKKSERRFPWYILGFTLLGTALGFLIAFSVAFIISQKLNTFMNMLSPIALGATILFGALGLIIGHSIEQKKKTLRG